MCGFLMTDIRIRPLTAADDAWAVALNNAAVPHVSAADAARFRWLAGMVACAAVAEIDGAPAGFIFAFLPGSDYDSENYRWFCARYDSFLYIDRVVVDAGHRGAGVGQALYRHVVEFGRGRADLLTCEVNEQPPNPGSMRFHERFGFRPLGRQQTEGGAKSVVMLGLELTG